MAPLDMVALSDELPAGENLENDPEFGQLEQAMKGKPEVQYGTTIEAAVPPDWKEATTVAKSLMKRTHDLRVLTHFAVAQLHLQGIPGFAQGMRLVRAQLEGGWDSVHPQLDPEDDNDPMQRANAVLPLADPSRVLRTLRDTVLTTTPRTGPVTWRDIATTNGTLAVEDGKESEKKTEAAIAAAFANADPERVAAMREAVGNAVEDSVAIPAAFDAKAGSGSGPNYADLTKLLRDIQKEVLRFAGTVAIGEPEPEAEPEPAAAGVVAPGPAAAVAPRAAVVTVKSLTSLSTREEALHALDLATSYFRKNEPSSPLPILMDRARKMSSMDFLEILKEMAPGGLSEAQVIAGLTTE